MAANQLNDVNGLVGPALESLNLTGCSLNLFSPNYNIKTKRYFFLILLSGNNVQQLHSFQTGCFGSLLSLELRGNRLETTDGLNLPNLQRLYLVQEQAVIFFI